MTWLGWATFPRILFPLCFWLGWAIRDILVWNLGAASKAAAIFITMHIVFICWFTTLAWDSGQAWNCCIYFWNFLQPLQLHSKVRVPSSVMKGHDFCRTTTNQGLRQDEFQSVLEVANSSMFFLSPTLYSSSPPDCLPCALQIPAIDSRATALQRLLNQVPQRHNCICTSIHTYMYI